MTMSCRRPKCCAFEVSTDPEITECGRMQPSCHERLPKEKRKHRLERPINRMTMSCISLALPLLRLARRQTQVLCDVASLGAGLVDELHLEPPLISWHSRRAPQAKGNRERTWTCARGDGWRGSRKFVACVGRVWIALAAPTPSKGPWSSM